ncbi:ABC transporter ATP-binding protein [Nonomuraea mesophila]|uniref:ABC transporter ATP-binding protein n=1 Tax=Nonomuraea mesophila TaxID=2530382 RepID=UPI001FE2A32F|nr:ATP-binding cassette domain-containing protein [Nonomuraea mesophila]
MTAVEVRGLGKTYGPVAAVTDLSFDVPPGEVTAFLGPNGAGKTTTMRMVLGLVAPDTGSATIGGVRYAALRRPASTVGAVLDSSGFHPDHTAGAHLRVYARMGGFPRRRTQEVMDLTGVTPFAGRPTRGLSTGMRQRLHLATALLGDPSVLLLDEPANGLDPEGNAWLRGFLRELAAQGRAVLVSSHVLSEVEQLADRVVVIREGRLAVAGPMTGLYAAPGVLIRTPGADGLSALLSGDGATVERTATDTLLVHGLPADRIAAEASSHGILLHEITPVRPTLEQAYLDLTGGPA